MRRPPIVPLLLLGLLLAGLPGRAGEPPVVRTPERALLWVFFRDRGPEAAPPGVAPADRPVHPAHLAAVRALGGRIRHQTRWFNGVSVEIDADRAGRLAALAGVARVEPVRRWRRPESTDPGALRFLGAGLPPTESTLQSAPAPATQFLDDEAYFYGPSFNQNAQVGILDLHRRGYTGAGVTICILDSGFRTNHPALAGRHLLAERDFVFGDDDVDNEAEDTSAAWNHGTSVWSNVGGYRPGTLVGGAWEAGILLGKTEDIRSETPIEEDHYIAALEWADSLGADIVTASLVYLDFDGSGSDYVYADLDGNTTLLARAVDMAVAQGMCVINAAGNFGPNPGTIWTPADADSVLSVGAVDSLGVAAGFTSRGPTADGRIKPEVSARGVRNWVASASTGGYGPASGTSFATPVTAGAAALVREAHPGWSGFQLREALRTTASHAATPDNITGHGLVNAPAAVALAPAAPPLVSLPFALLDPPLGALVPTTAPRLRWGHSLPGTPGDPVTYRVVLATNAAFIAADTLAAGSDSSWTPPAYLAPGQTYYWTVVATNGGGWTRQALRAGSFTVSATAAVAAGEGPAGPRPWLGAPSSNPLVGRTTVRFELPPRRDAAAAYRLNVLGVNGRQVRTLAEGAWDPAGVKGEAAWDGRSDDGRGAAAGLYFIVLTAPGVREAVRVVNAGSR